MRYADTYDLIRLPYFELNDAKKIVLKPQYKKYTIIDSHTHLGWSYLFGRKIDLSAVHERTLHFFPEQDNTLDLNHYSAVDFEAKTAKKARYETVRGAFDTKGFSKTHTIPNILEEMDRMGIAQSITLAIDFPFMSNNSEHILLSIASQREFKKRIIPFVSLHPLDIHKERNLMGFIEKGARGIKLHPQIQMFRPTDRGAYEIYELAKKHSLPILFHTGLSPISPQWQKRFVEFDDFATLCRDFPDNTFILGHSGVLEYERAMELSEKYEHVYLELSGQPPQVIGEMIRKNGHEKLLFGSDWPYYPSIIPLAKVLLATEREKDEVRARILGANAQRLFGL